MKNILSVLACTTFLLIGCQNDVSIVDRKETRVVVDSFIQANKVEKLDVLVVVDTSGSMSDNFDDVGSGMEMLRVDIENLTLDYQFGFITTDPNNLSYIGPYDSTSSSIDILLAPNLLNSAGREEGFAATYAFLNSEEYMGFSRSEADFLLFIISDEDEQSSIDAPLFQEWLTDEFTDVRHDIVTVTQFEDSQCGYTYDVGYKYIELSGLYNKSAMDICDENWSVWLSESSFITQQKDYIELSEGDPILDSIVVYVDNEVENDWEYLEGANAVVLGFIPDYGSLVEVGYNVYAHT